jgi:hypothetical protein
MLHRIARAALVALLLACAPAHAQDDGPSSTSGPQPVEAKPSPSPSASAAASPAASPSPAPPGMVLREGDVVAGRASDGAVRVMKILKISFIEGDRLLHSVAYKESFKSYDDAAAAHTAKQLTVAIAHLPIDGEGLTAEANKVLANEPVQPAELEGYKAYLKEMGQ